MKCSKCGQLITENDKFCPNCGAINQDATQLNMPNLNQSTNPNDMALANQNPQPMNNQVVEPMPTQNNLNNQVVEPMPNQNNLNNQVVEPIPTQNNLNNQVVEPIINNVQPNINQSEPINVLQNQPINNVPVNNNQTNKKFPIKLIIIIGAIVVIGLVVVFVFLNKSSGGGSTVLNDSGLIMVKKSDKYGYINTDGKFVIEPKYIEASDFYGNYAVVKSDVNTAGEDRDVYQLIDSKGVVKAESSYTSDIKHIDKLNLWVVNGVLYDESFKQISNKDYKVDYQEGNYFKWYNSDMTAGGIMTKDGKITYTYRFLSGESYLSVNPSNKDDERVEENYCIVNVENEKYAVVNCDTGNVVHDYSEYYLSDEYNNTFTLKVVDTWDFISMFYVQDNKIIYKTEDDKVDISYYGPGYLELRDENKSYSERYSYFDIANNTILTESPVIEKTEQLDEWETLTGITKKYSDSNYGLTKDGKDIIPCQWDDIDFFDPTLYQYLKSKGKDYVMGLKDSKVYLLDLKDSGKSVAEFNSTYIADSYNSAFIYYTDATTGEIVIYNLITGSKKSVAADVLFVTHLNYIVIKENNKNNYYNDSFKLIYSEEA